MEDADRKYYIASRILIIFSILITLYIGLTKSETSLIATFLLVIAFFTMRSVNATDVETDPYLDYIKASTSRMGIKLPIPLFKNLQSRSLNYTPYMSKVIDGGIFYLFDVFSCPCGAEDFVFIKPYKKREKNDDTKTNILGYLDHKREPRSAPQIRRMLRSFGITDDPSEIAQKLYSRMVMSRTVHRSRLRSPIAPKEQNPILES